MLILGIETSCDETASAVIEASGGLARPRFKILSNVVSSQIKLHAKYGGVVPNLAAREHLKNLPIVLKLALREAKLKNPPDLVAVTRGPGLIPALLVGVHFSRAFSYASGIPILGVNHLEGHIYSNWLRPGQIKFPAICLIVSGGHTELLLMKNYGEYELLGATRDDAVGEAYDKVARLLGLGFPGGPMIDKLAGTYSLSPIPYAFRLPRPMINSKNYDFSFSGLKTAVLYLLRDLKHVKTKVPRDAISAEFQQAVVDVLAAKTLAAAREFRAKTIMISGGVSANSALRAAFKKTGALFPTIELTGDNAVMIAIAGYFNHLRGKKDDWSTLEANANLPIA